MSVERLRWLGLPVVALMMFAFVAACGDGGDDTGNDGNTDSSEDGGSGDSSETPDVTATDSETDSGGDTPDSSDPDATSDDGDTPDSSDPDATTGDGDSDDGNTGDGDSGGTGSDGLEVLEQAASQLENGTYRVVYDVEGPDISGEFTFASKPPASMFGMSGAFEGQEGDVLLINLEDATYFCSSSSEGDQCLKLAKDGPGGLPFELPTAFSTDEMVQDALDKPGVTATEIGSRTIAGIEAECFEVTSDEGDEGEYCIGDELMLYMEATVDGEAFRIEAKEAETDAGSITIEVPPYPVTDMSGLTE